MTFQLKKRIVFVTLAVVTIWPLVHHALVRMTDMHPQKGLAWSMYCVPSRSIGARVTTLGGRLRLTVELLDRPKQRKFKRAKNEFLHLRAAFGTWAAPDEMARVVFEVFPRVDEIQIVVQQAGVDASTAVMVIEKVEAYDYLRGDTLGEHP